ncbi:MAG TPA: hypothetical protein VJI46_00235 [Candidatus Nanoarchaeia archaeon]|nr:hypothetical protein [Candidatus Nanoarchaeia archaeon]
MSQITLNAIGIAAPYYSLVLVVILLALFIYLFRVPNKGKVYDTPWKFLFFAIIIFVIEEAMTVLSFQGIIDFPRVLFAFFELAMIGSFTYMCLLQKEHT